MSNIYIFKQTLVDLSTFRWYPRSMHDFREFDVFHNVILSIYVKHSAKHRGTGQRLLGLCKLLGSKST